MANPTTTVSDYCGVLARSRLLPSHEVANLADRWRSESRSTDAEVDGFRKYLVSRRLLTEYQAAMVQRGHADGYFVDSYVILDRIGKGQMAGVYKAVHSTGQVVALKVLASSKAKTGHVLARFQREARLLTQLNHPNIVRAYQLATTRAENGTPGVHYIAMEYLEGETLDEVIARRKKLPPAEAARLLAQALDGLQHLHDKRMVHRDLKPANLMLVPATAAKAETTLLATLKILDIGLGRELFDDDNTATQDLMLTAEGSLVGTPDYLAPEQARDARLSDVRSDIYSLGCVLFALLAGRPPFLEKNVMATMVKHATEPVPTFQSPGVAVPPGLQAIVNRMVAKDPADRYQTPGEASFALQPYLPSDAAEAMTTTLLPGFEEYLNSDDGNLPIPMGAMGGSKPAPAIRVTPDGPIPNPLPRSLADAKAKPVGLSATAPQSATKPRANVSGPPSGKIKMGTGLAAALASPAPAALKQPSSPARPSPLPPTGPMPEPEGEFDVELVGVPAQLNDPADVLQARMADIPMRPLYDLDRRDFIMLSLGAGGVLAAVGLGLVVARWQGHKIQQTEDE
jgi:eukaryotic-like serine/threonine-protein kinase